MDAIHLVVVIGLGFAAGTVGALLGLGGGIFLVPALTWIFDLPVRQAAGVGLMTVIATSGAVSSETVGHGFVNTRLGMLLLVGSSVGGLAGGVTAQYLSEATVALVFAITTAAIAALTVLHLDHANVVDDAQAQPSAYGGRFFDPDRGREVVYHTVRLPLAVAASVVAGNVSGLLGLGGGVLQVPVLNLWCGVPIRVATATSAFLIGLTALSSAPIYFAHGNVDAHYAAASVIGVLGGARWGVRFGTARPKRHLKVLLAAVLIAVSGLMFLRWWRVS
ncbi:MAG: sulfite exporter TauE/SafE family protein [Vicinamibacteraceae bacterium]